MSLFLKRIFQLNNYHISNIDKVTYLSKILRTKLQSYSIMSGIEFKGTTDRYEGVLIDSAQEYCTADIFPEKLTASLNLWESLKKHGIWFKVALEHTQWVPILAQNGFDFHHAKQGYVMMYKWLPKDLSCRIPVYAHTMMAVGAVVINEKSQILVVKERHFIRGHWKFPGGMVEPGENLVEAAQREVKEETNIEFKLDSIVCFMHALKGNYNCSDLYTLVAGKAVTTDIVKCEREIEECIWINIDEYLEREDVTPFNKEILMKYLDYQKNKINLGYTEGVHKISKRAYRLYSVHFGQ